MFEKEPIGMSDAQEMSHHEKESDMNKNVRHVDKGVVLTEQEVEEKKRNTDLGYDSWREQQ